MVGDESLRLCDFWRALLDSLPTLRSRDRTHTKGLETLFYDRKRHRKIQRKIRRFQLKLSPHVSWRSPTALFRKKEQDFFLSLPWGNCTYETGLVIEKGKDQKESKGRTRRPRRALRRSSRFAASSPPKRRRNHPHRVCLSQSFQHIYIYIYPIWTIWILHKAHKEHASSLSQITLKRLHRRPRVSLVGVPSRLHCLSRRLSKKTLRHTAKDPFDALETLFKEELYIVSLSLSLPGPCVLKPYPCLFRFQRWTLCRFGWCRFIASVSFVFFSANFKRWCRVGEDGVFGV